MAKITQRSLIRMRMQSPVSWFGGKRLLVKQLIPMIPEHRLYVELFAGGAWLFFAKEPSKFEIINDINVDLTNFYRVIKHHPDEFLRLIQLVAPSRDEFELQRADLPEMMTDINRAVRFYTMLKLSFATRSEHFAYGTKSVKLNKETIYDIVRKL